MSDPSDHGETLENPEWRRDPAPGQNEEAWEKRLIELFAELVAEEVLADLRGEKPS